MAYYMSAPNCTVQFVENGKTHEHGNLGDGTEGIVEQIRGTASKPASFFDGGSNGTRYVFWGDLQGNASCQELEFTHSEATASAIDLTTEDVFPDGFSLTINFGGSPVVKFSECSGQYDGPGITTRGNAIFYQGTTTIRIYDPDITASP